MVVIQLGKGKTQFTSVALNSITNIYANNCSGYFQVFVNAVLYKKFDTKSSLFVQNQPFHHCMAVSNSNSCRSSFSGTHKICTEVISMYLKEILKNFEQCCV